jgi:prepilin-type N-terminal cleavage/methylation domain-containing protein
MGTSTALSRRATAPRAAERGMTLMELLAALSIFAGVAGMVVQILGGGLDLWSTGERTRDDSEQATALLDRIALELRHAVSCDGGDGEPRVKMLCDFLAIDSNGDGTQDLRAQRLIFVRRLFEEQTMPALREAGYKSGGQQPWFGEARAAPADLLPTEGLVEVALVPQPDLRKGYEGRLVLWRGLKSPIGGSQSLFARAVKDGSGLEGALLEPLAEDVLYFGLAFIDPSVSDVAAAPDAGGPLVLWDSTRGLLPAGDGYAGFRHARGANSLVEADDDVFPQAIRVTVILAAPPDQAPRTELLADLQSSTGSLRVELKNGQRLRQLGATMTPMKIGHEWVEAGDSDGVTLAIGRRGLFGTATSSHPAGTTILQGRRFERIVALPSPRSDLADRSERPDRKK